MTFKIPIEDVEKPSHFKPEISYRDIQKTIDFGLAYGMSEFKLSSTMEVSIEVAAQIIEEFFSIVPDVKAFLDALGYSGKKNGYIRTPPPFGRIRWFEGHDSQDFRRLGEIERAAKNHPIQGSNADIIKLALLKCYEYIREKDWWNPVILADKCKLIHNVHDEIQSEVNTDIAEYWKSEMNRLMLEAGAAVVKSIRMKVDCGIADHWSK